jgi:multiple sugar transport system substrate-binding protein
MTSKEISKKALESKETINDPFRYSHFENVGKGAFPTEELSQDLLETVKQGINNPNADMMIPGGWEYMQILDQNIYLAYIHKLSAEEALQKTEEEWNDLTEQYGREQQALHYNQWLNLLGEVRNHEMAQ